LPLARGRPLATLPSLAAAAAVGSKRARDEKEEDDDDDEEEDDDDDEEEEAPAPAPASKKPRNEEAAAPAAAPAGEVAPLQVFMKGIPFDCDEEAVKAYFGEHAAAATITDIDMPKFEDSGRSRGMARISLSDQAGVDAALALNGADFNGRNVSIELAAARPPRASFISDRPPAEPSNTVFLGNLSFAATEEELRAAFDGCGGIVSVRIATDRETGNPRGCVPARRAPSLRCPSPCPHPHFPRTH